MEQRVFSTNSDDYLSSLLLRYKILRAPIDLTFSQPDFEKDKKDIHIGLFEEGAIVATLTFSAVALSVFKMRQVAVDSGVQRKGYGKKLIALAEHYAQQNKITKIVCHARDTAVPFYEKLGYERSGDLFMEVGIPHFFMQKTLK